VANEKLGVVVPADRLREEILKIPRSSATAVSTTPSTAPCSPRRA
jgi:hypothetical protein